MQKTQRLGSTLMSSLLVTVSKHLEDYNEAAKALASI